METLVPNLLWTDSVPMEMAGLPAGRRMAIARNREGDLVVFSPVPASDAAISEIRQIGTPVAFVLQSRFHDNFYDQYFNHFPKARFLARGNAIKDHKDWPLEDFSAGTSALNGLDWCEIEGMPGVQEHVFFHRATRTLIVADFIFNIPAPSGFMKRLTSRMADIGGPPPRTSRFWRFSIKNRARYSASVARILAWDFDRLIPGHGEIIPTNAKTVLRSAVGS